MDCVFCKIVKGDLPSHQIWEDEKHVAFLSIFPNTKGFTVVIPKDHYSSYIFDQENDVITDLMIAAKNVAQLIDSKFEDVGRTGVIFEGFGVDHLHAKLFPMHGTKQLNDEWKQVSSDIDVYFDQYRGYISSHDSHRADDKELGDLANFLRS